MPAMLSGSTAKFRHRFIREQLGEGVWEEALARLDDEERTQIELSERGTRVATRVEGRLVDIVMTRRFGTDREAAEEFLRRGGCLQADETLDGMFKVFAHFVTPETALSRGPAIIGAAYSGVDVCADTHSDHGTLTIAGLGDFPYASPWMCGWLERAMERFGGAKAHVHETTWRSGLNAAVRLEFVVGWE